MLESGNTKQFLNLRREHACRGRLLPGLFTGNTCMGIEGRSSKEDCALFFARMRELVSTSNPPKQRAALLTPSARL